MLYMYIYRIIYWYLMYKTIIRHIMSQYSVTDNRNGEWYKLFMSARFNTFDAAHSRRLDSPAMARANRAIYVRNVSQLFHYNLGGVDLLW